MNDNNLVKYIRNRNGHPIGAIVATGRNHVGWSLCHRNDQFDRELAIRIAAGRANTHVAITEDELPYTVRGEFISMLARAQRYFK